MARPEKNSVDYFPYICSEGEKMYYLEETYGNDGFATFVKILIALAKTEYHYLNLSKTTTLMFLSAKCKISKDILESIIKDLVDLGKFDSVLWNENKVIWCQDFIDSIQDAYIKRKNKCITYDGLLHLLISLGVRKQGKSKPIVPVKPQSIVEETIEEESKEDIPSIEDFKNYAVENCKDINIESVELKYKAWVANDWKDGKDKKIKNWKTKILNTLTYLPKNGKQGFQNNQTGNTGSKEAILPSSDLSTEWSKDQN